MKKIFPLLTLIMGTASAASLPLISNEARYCYPGTEACASLEVVSINSADPALNKLADELLEAQGHSFDKAGLEKLLRDGKGEKQLMPDKPEGKIDPAEKDAYDYHHRRVINQVGESEHYRQLEKYEGFSTGGAGGENGQSSYYLVSKDQPQLVKLADIVLPDQQAALDKLHKDAWLEHLKKKGGVDGKPLNDKEFKELAKIYPSIASEQWRLTKDGLVFVYPELEINEIVLGEANIDGLEERTLEAVDLTVPAAELKDIVKPEILKEMASWQDTPPEKDKDDMLKATAKPQWRDGEAKAGEDSK